MILDVVQLTRLGSLEQELVYIAEAAKNTPPPETPDDPPPPTESSDTSATPSEDPLLVEGHMTPARKTMDVNPVYPSEAQQARVEGEVVLETLIDATGNVANVRVLESVPGLDQAAIDAVKQWKYEPTLLDGVGVPIVMTVNVNFTLE